MVFAEYVYIGNNTPIRYFLVDFSTETKYNRMCLISSSISPTYDYGYLAVL